MLKLMGKKIFTISDIFCLSTCAFCVGFVMHWLNYHIDSSLYPFPAGDWLQGPHVYALYESYGMTVHQIEILFVAGFGSSMIVGTVVGSFADR